MLYIIVLMLLLLIYCLYRMATEKFAIGSIVQVKKTGELFVVNGTTKQGQLLLNDYSWTDNDSKARYCKLYDKEDVIEIY